jgi:hypothetical protein
VKVHDLSVFVEKHPEIIDMTWQSRADLLNKSGHLNPGSASKPWAKSSLRKPFTAAVELLALGRSPVASIPPSGGSESALQPAAPTGGSTTLPSSLKAGTARPLKAESQGTSQSLPAASSTVLSSGSNIAALSPVSTATPVLGRRALTEAEKAMLLGIIDKRKVATKTVMDELGLQRQNCSLWMAVHQGTTVTEDMLERLANWFDVHEGVLSAAA